MTTMRFGPFVWPVNPTEIRVEGGRSTREALFPSPSLQEEGEKLSRVTGRGVFTGPDAAAQFSALHALLETGGAEILTVPEYGPLRAILTELILLRGSMRMWNTPSPSEKAQWRAPLPPVGADDHAPRRRNALAPRGAPCHPH